MKLSDQKKASWEKTLRDSGLISPNDTIQEHTKGDLWDMGRQIQGDFFFTTEKFAYVSGGLFGNISFSTPYNKITELKLCNVGGLIPIMPTGIRVTYTDDSGKTQKKKCSVMKRKEWLAYLQERQSRN
ncbi:MAG: hypothetical protein K1W30_05020 [Lachnospiraceae bacterium]